MSSPSRQQAWQWFDTKKDKTKSIKADTCPYAFKEWHFKGKTYTNMKAVEATAEQLGADGRERNLPMTTEEIEYAGASEETSE